MEFISERVSIDGRGSGTSFVISARLPKKQLVLLVLWLAVWTLCGLAFAREAAVNRTPEMRMPLWVMLAFWAYFELRILRVVLWRTKGFELWRAMEGELIIKNSLFGYGKASRYFIANIQRLGLLNMDKASWKWQMSDSFWTRGAEQLGFEYQGRKVA
ncbi:MAG: hypothetical protein JST45_02445, partial [Bacteroidetes bacterium]|nr:hypothetical protein [Bacteroidota bacterium]